MIYFKFLILILFFIGCSQKEPVAVYEPESIKIIYTSSKNLNIYDGESHPVVLMVYQMNEIQKFDSLTKNVNGIDKLLKNTIEDPSIVSVNKYIVNPNENQEIGVFLLLGTSGIGKTQTAIELADLIFNNKKAITTINMGEFQEKHSVSRLIGSPPGYVGYGEGGMLSEAVRKKPYSVVLIDEVEKAHPDILNIFYQVFDKGILVDGEGKEINFKDTLIIMTSNLGSDILENLNLSDKKDFNIEKLNELLIPSLLKVFKQALLARIEVLPYLPLKKDSLKIICKNKLNELKSRISNNNINLVYNDAIIDSLISSVLDKNNGVRDLEKIISNKLIPEISKLILSSQS